MTTRRRKVQWVDHDDNNDANMVDTKDNGDDSTIIRRQETTKLSPPSSSSSTPSPRPPMWKIWWTASRPHTLTASIAPNIVAYAAGITYLPLNDDDFGDGYTSISSYRWIVFQWTIFCILMQLGCNLHNDYADFVKGADTPTRVGQARATAKGWLSPTTTARAATFTLLLGFVIGINMIRSYLLVSTQLSSSSTSTTTEAIETDVGYHVTIMVIVILTSIFNAFAYTGGPWPLGYIGLSNFSLGYSGLGDLFVFLYFGLVATIIPPYLYLACHGRGIDGGSDPNEQKQQEQYMMMLQEPGSDDDNNKYSTLWDMIRIVMVPYALQVAVLATNIIIVNNLRDRYTDVHANKRTLAVRFGATFCRLEYSCMIGIAYGLVLLEYFDETQQSRSVMTLLPFLSFPLAYKEWNAIYQKDGSDLNPHVGGSAKVQFIFCILLGLSLRIPSWIH